MFSRYQNIYNNEEIICSFVIPAYNAEKYIEECIMSILKQTVSNIEVLVVNDGSLDETENLVKKIMARDNRVQLIVQDNSGVSEARNKGIEHSQGKYIVFVDADDYLADDYLEYMLNLIQNMNFAFSTSWYMIAGEKQIAKEVYEIISSEKATEILLSPQIMVGCWNKIYNREFLIKNGIIFNTELFYGEGLEFITRVAQKTNKIGMGNRKVYFYRRDNAASATTKFKIENFYNGEKSLQIIKSNFEIENSSVINMWYYHMCLFYVGALNNVFANQLEKEFVDDVQRWKSYLRENTFQKAIRANVSFYRKCLVVGGCVCPKIMSKLAVIKRKYIYKHSVQN